MAEWYFQPTKSKYYTKLGGIGKSQWFGLRVPVIEGIFVSCEEEQPPPKKSIPAIEIRWILEHGRMVMVHESKLGLFLGHFWILSTPENFETAKRITGFKPYKHPLFSIFGIPFKFEN